MVGAIAKELAKHPNSTINANGKYVDNSDVYKIASAILSNTVSHSSLGLVFHYLLHKITIWHMNKISCVYHS